MKKFLAVSVVLCVALTSAFAGGKRELSLPDETMDSGRNGNGYLLSTLKYPGQTNGVENYFTAQNDKPLLFTVPSRKEF